MRRFLLRLGGVLIPSYRQTKTARIGATNAATAAAQPAKRMPPPVDLQNRAPLAVLFPVRGPYPRGAFGPSWASWATYGFDWSVRCCGPPSASGRVAEP
jgi:hypothetical protein